MKESAAMEEILFVSLSESANLPRPANFRHENSLDPPASVASFLLFPPALHKITALKLPAAHGNERKKRDEEREKKRRKQSRRK